MQWAEDFLKIYYWEDILNLVTSWPDDCGYYRCQFGAIIKTI